MNAALTMYTPPSHNQLAATVLIIVLVLLFIAAMCTAFLVALRRDRADAASVPADTEIEEVPAG